MPPHRDSKAKYMVMVLPGIVEELLGADLMEHNILHKVLTFWTQTIIFNILQFLHKGIGVTETLETLARSSFSHTLQWCQLCMITIYSWNWMEVIQNVVFIHLILTLALICRFHNVAAAEQPTDPQWSYFQVNLEIRGYDIITLYHHPKTRLGYKKSSNCTFSGPLWWGGH